MTGIEKETIMNRILALPDDDEIKQLVKLLSEQVEFSSETAARLAYENGDLKERAEKAEAALAKKDKQFSDLHKHCEEMLVAKDYAIANLQKEKDAEIERLRAENNELREEFEELAVNAEGVFTKNKAEIARLQAEAGVYRQAMIETCRDHCEEYGSPGCRDAINEPCKEKKALDSSTAGAELLARLEKLEALFAKAQLIELKGGGGFIGILADDALAALDGAWRCGPNDAETVARALIEKMEKNRTRVYPRVAEDEPSEHVRTLDGKEAPDDLR